MFKAPQELINRCLDLQCIDMTILVCYRVLQTCFDNQKHFKAPDIPIGALIADEHHLIHLINHVSYICEGISLGSTIYYEYWKLNQIFMPPPHGKDVTTIPPMNGMKSRWYKLSYHNHLSSYKVENEYLVSLQM